MEGRLAIIAIVLIWLIALLIIGGIASLFNDDATYNKHK